MCSRRLEQRPVSLVGKALLPALLLAAAGCELSRPYALITVYNPSMKVSLPVPQGWRSEVGDRAGFKMQTFTGPSVDVPERPGIRAQVMAGPLPSGADLDALSRRYTEGHEVTEERSYSLHGFGGRSWSFRSPDGTETCRLMLTPIEGTLYGLYVHGEAATMESYRSAIDSMWESFSVEEGRFFEPYERPEVGLFLKHPRSWRKTAVLGQGARSLFVAFRSPPLLLESGNTTIHATLEINVNEVPPGTTLEGFYTERADMQGDNYRLLSHDTIRNGAAFSDLYHVETQLASFRERTLYFLEDGRSYIFKFNVQSGVYRQIEAWIDEIVKTFEPGNATPPTS